MSLLLALTGGGPTPPEPPQVSGSGAYGAYPQPSNTPEWLGKIPKKVARRIERQARAARAGEVDEAEAVAALLRSLQATAAPLLQQYEEALRGLIALELERVADLARSDEFQRMWIRRRNQNALRVLMLMSLH